MSLQFQQITEQPKSVIEKVWKPNDKGQSEVLRCPDSVFEVLGGGAAGGGKAIWIKEDIRTKDGWKTLENIIAGDIVFDENGQECSVLIAHNILYDRKCFEFTFDDGSKIISDSEHNWSVYNLQNRENLRRRGNGTPYVLKTSDIVNTLRVGKENRTNYSIPIAKSLNLAEQSLPIDPYILGLWLGDGNNRCSRITNSNSEIISSIQSIYSMSTYDYDSIEHKLYDGVQSKLNKLDLLQNKHIPAIYLNSSIKQRFDLLKGLMDSDGHANLNGSVEFDNTNKKLSEDVLELILSLGFKANLTTSRATYYNRIISNKYKIKWTPTVPVFKIALKLSKQKTISNGSPSWRYIVSAKKVDSVPVRCLTVNSPGHLYLVGKSLIPTHNTDLGIMIPPVRQFTDHPKFKGLILRRTFPDLEKEIVPRQREWYPHMGAVYNETKKVWKFPAGSYIQNGHAEREDDVRKYDSAEYNYIDWDESTHFTKFQYLYLSISRCRSSSPDLPAFVRAFTNPGNVGHAFFKGRFVDPFPTGRTIIVDSITGQRRLYIPFRGDDNPHLLTNDPGYLKRLEGLPENERRAKLLGSWDAYEGQVFSEFRALKLVSEPANALHVIQPFPIPDWWPRVMAIDWGFDAMTFIIWAAISPSGRCFIYRTAAWTRKLIKVWSGEAAKLTGSEELEDVVICHSAGQHKGEDLTIREQVQQAFDNRYMIRLGERDRIGGKNLVHEYLRWEQKPSFRNENLVYDPELAAKLLRIRGEQAYSDYLSLFAPILEESNLPKLQIFSHSPEGRENKELIDVIPACIPDEGNPEDVAEFPGDDPYDCLRMILGAAQRFIIESSDRMEEKQRREELINELLLTGNQTAYYMGLERLEDREQKSYSISRKSPLGRRRFSSRATM